MDKPRVIVIAGHAPLTMEELERERTEEAEASSPSIREQLRQIRENGPRFIPRLEGRLASVLDLVEYGRSGRKVIPTFPERDKGRLSIAHKSFLNGIYLCDFLEKRGIETVRINNLVTDRDQLLEALQEGPLVVALFTTFLESFEALKRAATFIREHAPRETKIIAGGSYLRQVMQQPERFRRFVIEPQLKELRGCVDTFIVEPQGEMALWKAVEALSHGRPLEGLPNLVTCRGEELVWGAQEPEQNRLDENAISWERLDPQALYPTLSTLTSRGCPFQCKFCTFVGLSHSVEPKSIETLRRELRAISGLGIVRHLFLADDNLALSSRRVQEVCRMMIAEELPFGWSCAGRSDAIGREEARLLKEAGCEYVQLGIESGDERMLKNMGKRTEPSRALRGIEALKEAGILAGASLIVGFPGETEGSIGRTIDFINRSGIDFYKLLLFRYYPSMPIYQERKQYGLQGGGEVWSHATMDSLQASACLSQIHAGTRAFRDGYSPWEVLAILRNAEYSLKTILEIFRIYAGLSRLELESPSSPQADSHAHGSKEKEEEHQSRREALLQELERAVQGATSPREKGERRP